MKTKCPHEPKCVAGYCWADEPHEKLRTVRNETLKEAAKSAWNDVMKAAKKMDNPEACALMADIAESAVLALKNRNTHPSGCKGCPDCKGVAWNGPGD